MSKEMTKDDIHRIAYEEIEKIISDFYDTDDDHYYHFFKQVETVIDMSDRIMKQIESGDSE